MNLINGFHHITAIGRNAQLNHDFYTTVMGMRLVKKTVNFDDPDVYHLYFGDMEGTPGTILTFFPRPGIRRGHPGVGMVGETGFSVPMESMSFWKERLEDLKVNHQAFIQRFGETILPFEDSEGLRLNMHFSHDAGTSKYWTSNEITEEYSVRGFKSISLLVKEIDPTSRILTEILGYTFYGQEGNCYRYISHAKRANNVIDLFEIPRATPGLTGAGTYHHVAFRVKDEAELLTMGEMILQHNLNVTEKIDRGYFYSVYFREPGGILFEIATDQPGFLMDESLSELGKDLKLPARFEHDRENIESILPPLIY